MNELLLLSYASRAMWCQPLDSWLVGWRMNEWTKWTVISSDVYKRQRHRNTSCVQMSWNLADRKWAVMRCLPDKKKQNFPKVSRSRFYLDRTQNLSGPAPNNILGVAKISSKSVHFRRSYSRPPNAWTSLKRATKYFQYSAKLLCRVIKNTESFNWNYE